MKKEMIIRTAYKCDREDIVDMLMEYFHETIYSKSLTPNRERVGVLVDLAIEQDRAYIVRSLDDELAAYMAINPVYTYYDQPEMDIEIFVVHPDFRGTGASRVMVDVVKLKSEQLGCGVIYAQCGSGINEFKNDQLWRNLFTKKGFHILGTELVFFPDLTKH